MDFQPVPLPLVAYRDRPSTPFASILPQWVLKWVPTWLLLRAFALVFPGRKARGILEGDGVWIDDLDDIKFLWSNGFFGKGTLSRSEPSWRFSGLESRKGTVPIVSTKVLSS